MICSPRSADLCEKLDPLSSKLEHSSEGLIPARADLVFLERKGFEGPSRYLHARGEGFPRSWSQISLPGDKVGANFPLFVRREMTTIFLVDLVVHGFNNVVMPLFGATGSTCRESR